MRRGQIEIVGFMVIVLLMFFGLILYLQLSSNEGTDFITEAENNLEVSNLLSSIRLYTVCEDTTMNDVIRSCIENTFECGEEACAIVERDIPILVDAYGWNEEEYMFHIGEELFSPGLCRGNTFVDDYTTASVKVRLTYCY